MTHISPPPAAAPPPGIWNPFAKRRGALATATALCTAVIGIAAAVLPWRGCSLLAPLHVGKSGRYGGAFFVNTYNLWTIELIDSAVPSQ